MKKEYSKTIEQYLDMNDPDLFFCYGGGGVMSNKEVKAHIITLMHEVRAKGKTTSMSISCGDCQVSVFYNAKDESARISVNRNRKEATILFKNKGILDAGRIPISIDTNTNVWKLNHIKEWDV